MFDIENDLWVALNYIEIIWQVKVPLTKKVPNTAGPDYAKDQA